MAKFNVVSAYHNVVAHPQDSPLLGMVWHGKYYINMALPFGLRSAPYIFSAIADLVQWMLTRNHGIVWWRINIWAFVVAFIYCLGLVQVPRQLRGQQYSLAV